ncbi:metal-dependent hydrolase, partial [Acinetobacter baumannii]|nr:metal-dependent hydrolase [Acinetobacter baumannii]
KYWIKILKRKDINFTLKQLKDGIYLGFGGINRVGILSKAFVDMLDVRAENFDPLNMQTEQLEAEFREKLFGQTGFLRDYLS